MRGEKEKSSDKEDKKTSKKKVDAREALLSFVEKCWTSETIDLDIPLYKHNSIPFNKVRMILFEGRISKSALLIMCNRVGEGTKYVLRFTRRFEEGSTETLVFLQFEKGTRFNFSSKFEKVEGQELKQQEILQVMRDAVRDRMGSRGSARDWEGTKITFLTAILINSGWELSSVYAGLNNAFLKHLDITTKTMYTQNARTIEGAEAGGKKGVEGFLKRVRFEEPDEEGISKLWGRVLNWWQLAILDKITPLEFPRQLGKHVLKSIEIEGPKNNYTIPTILREVIDGISYEIGSDAWMDKKKINDVDNMKDKFSRMISVVVDNQGRSGKTVLVDLLTDLYGWVCVEAPEKGETMSAIKQGIIDELKEKPDARGMVVDLGRVQSNDPEIIGKVCGLLEKLRNKRIRHNRYKGEKASLKDIVHVLVLCNYSLPFDKLTPDRWIIHILEEDTTDINNEFARIMTSLDMSTFPSGKREKLIADISRFGAQDRLRKITRLFYKTYIEDLKERKIIPTWKHFEGWRRKTLDHFCRICNFEDDCKEKDFKGERVNYEKLTKYKTEKEIIKSWYNRSHGTEMGYERLHDYLSKPITEEFDFTYKKIIENINQNPRKSPMMDFMVETRDYAMSLATWDDVTEASIEFEIEDPFADCDLNKIKTLVSN